MSLLPQPRSRPAFFNGAWLDARDVRVSADDYGVLMGVAVAERLRTMGGAVYRCADHMHRLRRSLEVVGWDAEGISRTVEEVVGEQERRLRDRIEPGDDWGLGVFVTPGESADGRQPTVCVSGYPLPFARWARAYRSGTPLAVSSVRQVSGDCWPSELKCRSRMHYYLAEREAERRFPGSRPVLLDADGFVTESSTANIVLYERDQGLVTPPLADVLPGVSQLALFELAEEMGIARREERITPARLARADEAFLTSTSVCMLPAVALDGRPIGKGVPGPQFAQFLQAWSARVGVDVAAQAERFAAWDAAGR